MTVAPDYHTHPPIYGMASHDRPTEAEASDAAIAALMQDPRTGCLLFWKGRFAVRDGVVPLVASLPQAMAWAPEGAIRVYLGQTDAGPLFVADLSDVSGRLRPDGSEAGPDLGQGESFRDLRGMALSLSPSVAGAMAHGKSLVEWHRTHRFCANCGQPSRPNLAGRMRLCDGPSGCTARHFPRVDPVVIMLVEDPSGERILLGRPPHLPAGMLSCLAGFVEPGEPLESAVLREVAEEAGVSVDPTSILYQVSQPWPWPSSLMCAFIARAASTDLVREEEELEELRWFSRAEVLAMGEVGDIEQGYKLPRKDAVARLLIDRWSGADKHQTAGLLESTG